MHIIAKAIRSKPPVGILQATGTLTLKAMDEEEVAMLTALLKTLMHGKHPALRKAWEEAGMEELMSNVLPISKLYNTKRRIGVETEPSPCVSPESPPKGRTC